MWDCIWYLVVNLVLKCHINLSVLTEGENNDKFS